jgi:ribonuclease P protein component
VARPDQEQTRVATIVAKKVHSSAVKRHQYQRWLRAVAIELLPSLKQPYDMVWVAKPKITELASAREVAQKVRPLFDKLSS